MDTPRPPHRPRLDPKAARVVRSFRLHPATVERLDGEAKRTGESGGQVIDRLAKDLPDRKSNRAGFTAIELLVVLIVVLIIIGLAVPALLGSLRKGSVNDAANSIIRVSSQARQFARTRSLDATVPGYFGLIVVAPTDGTPTYCALTFGTSCPPMVADIMPQKGVPGAKPVSLLRFNANVVAYRGKVHNENDPSVLPIEPGQSVGWLYQYRTGYPIYPADPFNGGQWPTAANVNIGVDPYHPAGLPPGMTATDADKTFPEALRHFTLRTADNRYRSAMSIYQIGLSNVQDY